MTALLWGNMIIAVLFAIESVDKGLFTWEIKKDKYFLQASANDKKFLWENVEWFVIFVIECHTQGQWVGVDLMKHRWVVTKCVLPVDLVKL